MQYSKLGNSSLMVSEIGFGCMSLKDDKAENREIVSRAVDLGINYFDTADLYESGLNEVKVGELLKPNRSEIILATKVGNRMRADGSGWDWNPSKAYILTAVENSLKRLQTDYIDLYQLHGGTMDDPIDDIIEAFETLKEQGKIRYYGISSIRPNVIREYVKRSNLTSVMMQYSLLDRRPEEESLELLRHHGVGVLSRGSIAQGLLVDKPAKGYLGWSAADIEKVADTVLQITGKDGHAAQTAIRFVLQHHSISSAVIGIRTLVQLEDLVATADLAPLSAAEIEMLKQAAPPKYYEEHR